MGGQKHIVTTQNVPGKAFEVQNYQNDLFR
jgi:hypothetical protein